MALPEITEVERLRLQPGDIVVVHIDQHITAEQAERIKEHVEPLVAPHRVLVVSAGITFTVLEPEAD